MTVIGEITHPEGVFALCIVLLWVSALYCIMLSRNLIRILIGVELISKALTLLLAAGGYLTAQTGFSQALIVTLIVVEVVLIAVAAGIVVGAYHRTGSLDVCELEKLKG